MNVTLTGATGFVGSHVLTELLEGGHEVTALVRGDDQADIVAARGAKPAVVDLYGRPVGLSLLSGADAAIHTASPGDETSADLDSGARLGDCIAEALLLDQGTFAAKARDRLDWFPIHPGLVDEFRHGSYAREARAA